MVLKRWKHDADQFWQGGELLNRVGYSSEILGSSFASGLMPGQHKMLE